jgi:hypothetical protein
LCILKLDLGMVPDLPKSLGNALQKYTSETSQHEKVQQHFSPRFVLVGTLTVRRLFSIVFLNSREPAAAFPLNPTAAPGRC